VSTARLLRERLVALRKAAGLSQADLAALIESPGRERRVGEWERGEVQPRPLHLVRLAAALQVDPLELLDVDPADPPLIALRFAAGLSLEGASLASGLSISAYRRLETGVVRSDPEPTTSQLLADALNVPAERLAQALARSRSEQRGNR
jgi:transcriptional regulator with XRE-family HTH domain